MGEGKIVRVVGLSSAVLFNKEDPLNPINRRISIIVMNKKAEEAAQHDGGVVKMDAAEDDETIDGAIKEGVETMPVATDVPVAH